MINNFSRRNNNGIVNKMLENISSLDNNKSIKYIVNRINSQKYQGHVNVNHNRITIEKIDAFLEVLSKYDEIEIPKGDAGEKNYDARNYPEFIELLENFQRKTCQGTQNSIRKNLSPDFERYRFIIRTTQGSNNSIAFIKGKYRINTNSKKLYWKITELGEKFLNSNKIEKEKILSESVNEFHNDIITKTFEVLKELEHLTFLEFLMFVNKPILLDIDDDIEESVYLIREWRNLGRKNQESLEIYLNAANPKKQNSINKKYKFDFPNWKNDTQQLIDTFKKLFLFKIDKKYNFNITLDFKGKKKRDKNIYKEYNEMHSIKKEIGYEYHHIIPISKAETNEQLILIDQPLNLIYIDGHTHAKFSQLGNPYVFIKEINQFNIILQDIHYAIEENNYIIEHKNAKYDYNNRDGMIEHNKKALTKLGYELT